MSGPQHHFMQNLNNPQQNAMRNQFGPNPMQNQLGNAIQNQLTNQLPVGMANQMNNPMMAQMASTLNNPMNPNIANNNQMLGQLNQQYNINANNPILQQQAQQQQTPQPPNPLQQIQPNSIEFSGNLQHHSVQNQQQQQQQQQVIQQQPTASVVATPPVPQQQPQQQQSKDYNTASLCRIGQETVQDIVSRTQDVFQTLRSIQPPNGTTQSTNASNEKKAKVQEQLRTIRVLFKRLRLIYEKCNENCQLQGMEYTHIESLIPFKDEIDPKHDEKKNSESYRLACEESKEIMEKVVLQNKQLKEIIDHLRRIIWEINTMLSMRRS